MKNCLESKNIEVVKTLGLKISKEKLLELVDSDKNKIKFIENSVEYWLRFSIEDGNIHDHMYGDDFFNDELKYPLGICVDSIGNEKQDIIFYLELKTYKKIIKDPNVFLELFKNATKQVYSYNVYKFETEII